MDKLPPPPPPPPPGRGRQGQQPGPGGGPSPDRRPARDGKLPGMGGDGERKGSAMRRWLPWVLAGAFIAVFLVPSLMSHDNGDEMTYTDFIALVEADKVSSVQVETGTGKISGELKDGTKFAT